MEWLNNAQSASVKKIFGGDEPSGGRVVQPSRAFMQANARVVMQLDERKRRMRYVYVRATQKSSTRGTW